MRSLHSTLLLLAALSACTPGYFRADAGAAFTEVTGTFGLQNSTGTNVIGANMNDLHDDLGAGDRETSPYLRVEADWGGSRVKASGFENKSSGTGTLAGDFGDIASGSVVSSDVEFRNATVSWSYDLAPTETLRIAPGVQLGYYGLDVSVRSTSPAGFENVGTDFIAPMPYLDVEVDIGIVSVGGNLGLMTVDLRDATSRYADGELFARVRPVGGVELIAGYRYIQMDAHGRATGRDFDADFEVRGFFVGGGIAF